MTDPLGFIGRAGQVGPGQGVGGGAPAGGAPLDPSKPTFKDLLMENIKQVNKLQQEADTAIEDLHTGKRDDVEGVLLATQKADAAFRMLLAVRNKVQQAVEEVKQLRV